MGFGEDYQGMDDRQILVEVATRLKIVEEKVDHIQCPSPKCQDHETRLTKLEQEKTTRKENQNDRLLIWGIVASVIMSALAIVATVAVALM